MMLLNSIEYCSVMIDISNQGVSFYTQYIIINRRIEIMTKHDLAKVLLNVRFLTMYTVVCVLSVMFAYYAFEMNSPNWISWLNWVSYAFMPFSLYGNYVLLIKNVDWS